MFGLIPKEEKFFDMFREMGATIVAGTERLKLLLDDYSDPISGQREIKEIEHRGDAQTHDIIRRLNKTFITPFDREDIHALATALDDILDLTDASAQRFVMYRVETPTPEARELAFIIVRCAHVIERALKHLSKKQLSLLATLPSTYAIRRAQLDEGAGKLLVEYDGSRYRLSEVTNILHALGLPVVEPHS